MTDDGRRTTDDGRRIDSVVCRLSSVVLLASCVALFLASALHQLPLPGLYYDEALDLAPMLDVMRGAPTPLLRGIGLTLGNYAYPVMLMDYMGSLNGYLSLPFMAALGPGVTAARLQPILFSARHDRPGLRPGALVVRPRCRLAHGIPAGDQPLVHLVQPAGHQRHLDDDDILTGQRVAARTLEVGCTPAHPTLHAPRSYSWPPGWRWASAYGTS